MGSDPLKLQIIGWYGKNNVGDEAYKLAFPRLFPTSTCTFGTFPKPGADVTIVGGGDCLSPDLLTEVSQVTTPKHLMSVTVSADYPASSLAGINTILVRDHASSDNLKAAGVPHRLCPDFTFALRPDAQRGKSVIEKLFNTEGRELYSKVVVVALSGHLLRDQDARKAIAFEKLTYDLSYVCDWTDASFLFVPFGTSAPWDDRAANGYVHAKPKWWKKNLTIQERLDPQTVLDIIAASHSVISSRLHSSIFAAIAGTPFVDIVHNHKNPAFLKTIDRSNWAVPYLTFDAERCRSLVTSFLTDSSHREKLTAISTQQSSILFEAVANARVTK